MSAGDVFFLAVRWLHLLAAATWVGGSIFYVLAVRPALRKGGETPSLAVALAGEVSALVSTCIVVLVATGAVLAFSRLTSGLTDPAYVVTLGFKGALSVWMFLLVETQRRRSRVPRALREPAVVASGRLGLLRRATSGYNGVLVLGLVVFLLSDLLKMLFEAALKQG